MTRLLAIAVISLLLGPLDMSMARAAEKVPVAIMEFTTKGGVTQQQMDALGDLLADTVRDLGRYRVIGHTDIRSVLMAQEKRAMVAGCNDVNCMAEIGGALGVRWMVVGNVSKFGKAFLLNIKLIDAEKVKVIASESNKISGGEEELIDAVAETTRRVFAKARATIFPAPVTTGQAGTKAQQTQTAGAANVTTVTEPAEPSRPMSAMKRWGHISFWSGVGLAAVGSVGLVMGKKEADRYADGNLGSWDVSRNWTGAGFALLGVGAAAMITGVVLWLLDPGPGEQVAAGLAPAAGGSGVTFSLSGSF